jgi:hypothetical protein
MTTLVLSETLGMGSDLHDRGLLVPLLLMLLLQVAAGILYSTMTARWRLA